jgi:hypothetical protein
MALINTTTTGVLGTTLFGDGAGDLTVQKDGVTINKITAAPAFSAYFTGSQTISDNVAGKVALNNETFDTNNCFDTSTYRFTPNVAGYYQISGTIYFASSSAYLAAVLVRSGYTHKYGVQNGNGQYTYGSTVTDIVYMNGTTDYVELYAYQNSGSSKTLQTGGIYNYFSGVLVRAA